MIQEVCFQSLVSCGLAGLPRYQFSAELNEMRCLDERESFVVYKSFSCCLLLSVLDTVLETKVLANKCKKIFPASICSKDLLGIIIPFNSDERNNSVTNTRIATIASKQLTIELNFQNTAYFTTFAIFTYVP